MTEINLKYNETIELIKKSKFFGNCNESNSLKSNFLKRKPIYSLDFSISFLKTCKNLNIINIQDLLNTLPLKFARLSDNIIEDAQDLILERLGIIYRKEFYNNKYFIPDLKIIIEKKLNSKSITNKIIELDLISYPFFDSVFTKTHISNIYITEAKLAFLINELPWGTRFSNFLKINTNILTTKDLLNIPTSFLLKSNNLGISSIKHSQDVLLEFLSRDISNYIKSKIDYGLYKYPFFETTFIKVDHQQLDVTEAKLEFSIKELPWGSRFLNYLENHPDIINIKDLLNIPTSILLRSFSIGIGSVKHTQNVVLKFFSQEISNYIKPTIAKYPFFIPYLGIKYESKEIHEDKLSFNVNDLNWSVRFYHFLNSQKEIETVEDLLNIPAGEIIHSKNIGKKTIKDAQNTLINFFTNQLDLNEVSLGNLEEKILYRINNLVKNKRDINFFFEYYNYYSASKTSLEEIGKKNNLTRERVRQIISRTENKIFNNKYIIKEVIEDFEKKSFLIDLKTYILKLTNNNQISHSKSKFFTELIKNTLYINKRFVIDNEFVYLKNNSNEFSKIIYNLNKDITDFIKDKKETLEANHLLTTIKAVISNNEFKKDYYINLDVLRYLSKKYHKFYIIDDQVYNEMLYNIFYGYRIKEIVYYCMIFINEPIHFKILADFIRKKNKKLKHIHNSSVSIELNSSDKYITTGWGIFSLKTEEKQIYHSAVDAIINLLEEKSPLQEQQIVNLIKEKHSDWNIKAALINNLNKKFIKIGNDLYDLKN